MTAMPWNREGRAGSARGPSPGESAPRFASRESVVVVVWLLAASATALARPVSATGRRWLVTGGGVAAPASDAVSETNAASRFLRDVGSDYKHFLSEETAIRLGAGGGAALAVHAGGSVDCRLRCTRTRPRCPADRRTDRSIVQIPVAIGWWIVGSGGGQRDVRRPPAAISLRAQLSVVSWTYAIKLVADRTRPNGDPRWFPSGHASDVVCDGHGPAGALRLEGRRSQPSWRPAYTALSRDRRQPALGKRRRCSAPRWGWPAAGPVTIHMRTHASRCRPSPLPGGIGVSRRGGEVVWLMKRPAALRVSSSRLVVRRVRVRGRRTGGHSREALIEQEQAGEGRRADARRAWQGRAVCGPPVGLVPGGHGRCIPSSQSSYTGGGFTLGAGYLKLRERLQLRSTCAAASRSSGYKRLEAEFIAPELFARRGVLSVLGGWRDATQVGFYGFGMTSTQENRKPTTAFSSRTSARTSKCFRPGACFSSAAASS